MTRWILTFTPVGDGPPVEQRIRRLLKLSLRTCGMRVVDVRAVDETDTPGAQGTK